MIGSLACLEHASPHNLQASAQAVQINSDIGPSLAVMLDADWQNAAQS
jgi:hypothetical protein